MRPQLKEGSWHHGGAKYRKMPRLRDQKYVLQKMPWGREQGVDPEPHDCRLNHAGSAKEMGKEGKGLWSKLGGGCKAGNAR